MQNIINATKYSFNKKSNVLIYVTTFGISIYAYYWAITQIVSPNFFFRHNPTVVVIGQVVLSLINAILLGLSFVFLREVFKNKQIEEGGNSLVQTVVALFFSIVTTGCYVCGSVLLPAIGIAASVSSLPFGGLEVKFLTAGLLLYSVANLAKQLVGYCELKSYKTYVLTSGSLSLNINFGFVDKLKPLAITLMFTVLIFALPALVPKNIKLFEITSDSAFCPSR